MTLAELNLLDRAYLLGIDCREDAIRAARSGTFAEHELEGVNDHMRSQYFTATDQGWRITAGLRRRTEWRVLDATREFPPGGWDIVLCRNLLIYLQYQITEAMLSRMVRELAPEGILVLGKAERPPRALELRTVGRCMYQTHGG
jgi:chemotaxis protein methyltransferase CheR